MKLSHNKLPNSRIHSDDVTMSEQILGYCIGPCLSFMVISALSGTYLSQFYTDVLGISGAILVWIPLLSKILSAFTGLLIGRMIDNTRTLQGKARPWILMAGPLLAISGYLLYCVPNASYQVQIVWIIISYNLFFSLTHCIYSLSHAMMIPLSTRNSSQRDRLSVLTTAATSMIPGLLVTIIMPLLVSRIGVGNAAQTHWLRIMGTLSILTIPAAILEYFFTVERVNSHIDPSVGKEPSISFLKQFHTCIRNKGWLTTMIFALTLTLCNHLSHSSMLYYSNWVLGNSIESGAFKQILVNMIGQAPMGFGVFLVWPAVRKYGKQQITKTGFAMAAFGCLLVFLARDNVIMVLTGLFIKSTGTLATYLTTSIIAEALDQVELQEGFRADGLTVSLRSISQTVLLGLSQSIVLAGIQFFGYITPESATQIIEQPESIQLFFRICFSFIPMMGYIVCFIIMHFKGKGTAFIL